MRRETVEIRCQYLLSIEDRFQARAIVRLLKYDRCADTHLHCRSPVLGTKKKRKICVNALSYRPPFLPTQPLSAYIETKGEYTCNYLSWLMVSIVLQIFKLWPLKPAVVLVDCEDVLLDLKGWNYWTISSKKNGMGEKSKSLFPQIANLSGTPKNTNKAEQIWQVLNGRTDS